MAEPFETWVNALQSGEAPSLTLRQRVGLLGYVCGRSGDAIDVVGAIGDVPMRPLDVDEWLAAAIDAGNESIALYLVEAGPTRLPLVDACAAGLSRLISALVDRGARLNRRFASEVPPVHIAARASLEAAMVLVEASCDLTAVDPDGAAVWQVAPQHAEPLYGAVGQHGPTWFRQAQRDAIDHYVFVSDDEMFGFNPNDVQTPIWTGNDDEGFGWPNTAAQARELLETNRQLREQVEWFLPLLDKLERGDDFSLDDLGPRVPRRRVLPRP